MKERRVQVPVTKLTKLFEAVADLVDHETLGLVFADDIGATAKPLMDEVEKAFNSVFQTHWGGAVYSGIAAEKQRTAEFLAAAEANVEAAADAEKAAQPEEEDENDEVDEGVDDAEPPADEPGAEG